jgi:hypothetical protein
MVSKKEETETLGEMPDSIGSRLERLRSLVDAMPDGDQDKEDLELLFSEYNRVKGVVVVVGAKLDHLERAEKHRQRIRVKRAKVRQLSGALNLARYMIKLLHAKIEEQQVTIDWLRRRVGQRSDLQPYEKDRLKEIAQEVKPKRGAERDHTVRE